MARRPAGGSRVWQRASIEAGRRVHSVRVDVARIADIDMMVKDTAHALGAPDILVNNAGVYPRVKLLEMRESDWDYVA